MPLVCREMCESGGGLTVFRLTRTRSRDRLAFSKSILKRYIRECVQRDAAIASPWVVKPTIALQFNIPQRQSAAGEARNKEIREGKLTKRRKVRSSASRWCCLERWAGR